MEKFWEGFFIALALIGLVLTVGVGLFLAMLGAIASFVLVALGIVFGSVVAVVQSIADAFKRPQPKPSKEIIIDDLNRRAEHDA